MLCESISSYFPTLYISHEECDRSRTMEIPVTDEVTCPIDSGCLGSYDRISETECGHKFSTEAIKTWVAKKDSCPICRKENISNVLKHYINIEPLPITIAEVQRDPPKRKYAEITAVIHSLKSQTVRKVVNTYAFKIIAIPFNCVHWIAFACVSILNVALKVLEVLAAVFMVGGYLLCKVALSPIAGLIVITTGGEAAEKFLNIVSVLLASPLAIPFLGLSNLVEQFDIINVKPIHTPISIWNDSLLSYKILIAPKPKDEEANEAIPEIF
jgi:Ring finger domain